MWRFKHCHYQHTGTVPEKSQSNAAVFYILFGSVSKGFLFGNQTEIKGSQNMTYGV